MFEKATEEYVHKHYLRQHGPIKYRKSVGDVWYDGVIYGYNKANEWHYVKDGDLPKDNEYVLIYTDLKILMWQEYQQKKVILLQDVADLYRCQRLSLGKKLYCQK